MLTRLRRLIGDHLGREPRRFQRSSKLGHDFSTMLRDDLHPFLPTATEAIVGLADL